jgi:uncharacterized protein YjbI with pentapeptide repeats
MAVERAWPVRLSPLGSVTSGAVACRVAGRLSVTIVVKATFELVHGGDMELVDPAPIFAAELHHRDNPMRSIRASSDLAPHLGSGEVMLTGHARAPKGQPAPVQVVRLAVYRGHALVDKTLHVYGDRKDGVPQPFDEMPLTYERAFGGIGWPGNPMGVGVKDGKRLEPPIHNLLDPADPYRTAGFGPVARAWPERRKLLGGADRKLIDKQPVGEIPDGFDWSYFHSAPEGQRCEFFQGDEWILLEGFHPEVRRIESRLPGAIAAARLRGLGVSAPVALVADTLRIDADTLRCSLTWRGAVAVEDELHLPAIEVVCGIELPGRPIAWPEEAAPPALDLDDSDLAATRIFIEAPVDSARAALRADAAVARPAPDPRLLTSPFSGTVALSESASEAAARNVKLPFQPAASPWAVMPVPRPAPAPEQRPPASFEGTVALGDREVQDAMRRGDLPFPSAAPAIPRMPPPAPPPPAPPPPAPPPPAPAPPRAGAGLRPSTFGVTAEVADAPSAASPSAPSPPAKSVTARRAIAVRASDGIPVVNRTPLVAAAMPAHVKPGQPARTVIVKGTFDLVPGGPARLRGETETFTGDVHAGDDLRRSLLYPTDFASWKPRADVTLKGRAHAPGGSSPAAQVRFRFGRKGSGFDRRIAVFGDRGWPEAVVKLGPSEPRRFESIPIVYEYAFGGPGFASNPVGLGYQGLTRPPNLEDPDRLIEGPADTPDPVGFGAVPAIWPERASRLGTYGAEWKKTRWPHFPDDMDRGFFQAAPAAQQLAHLDGDETFELVGMHREHPVIDGSLPRLRARCFAQRPTAAGAGFVEIALRLDTVTFDVDEMKLTLVWRGLVDVADDEASDVAELFVTTEPLESPRLGLAEAQALYEIARLALPPVGDDPDAPAAANDAGEPELTAHERRIRDRLRAAGILEATVVDARPVRAPAPAPAPAPVPVPPPRPPPELDPIRRKVQLLLAQGAPLAGLNLGGADLSDLDFSSRSLAGSNLKDTLLRRCRFAGADLAGAQLGGADLTDADLGGARLSMADLTAAILDGARLDGAELEHAVLERARGERASLRGARGKLARFGGGSWQRARFDRAELAGADFSGAELDEAVFDGAIVPEIRLYEARGLKVSWKGADLTEARADGAALPQSALKGVRARGSVWDGALLDDASFLGAILTGASFVKASALRAVFGGADLAEGRLGRARLAGASFLKANLMQAQLEGADLTGADLRAANLHAAETWKAKLRGAQLELAIVTQSKLEAET